MEENRGWRWGVNRWIVLALIILNAVTAAYISPVRPHVQLPPEVTGYIGSFAWVNTLTAMLITDAIVLLIAFIVNRSATSGNLVPTGFAGAVEALLEAIYNLTESTAGRAARTIFPFFASITIYVLIANWMEIIPGVDSIGIIEHAIGEGGHAIARFGPFISIVQGEGEYALVPYVRTLTTDLNFTVGLALFAVFMIQVVGLQALGVGYLKKFFNVSTFFSRPVFGVIDFFVGILELVSEFSKILSFSFRLFGNLFAGTVLLFVIGSLVPVFAQSIFIMLEFFVGLIQALVFGLLTMVFMSMATHGHEEHEEHEEEEMPIEGPEMI